MNAKPFEFFFFLENGNFVWSHNIELEMLFDEFAFLFSVVDRIIRTTFFQIFFFSNRMS